MTFNLDIWHAGSATEPLTCGGDAASRHITSTACYHYAAAAAERKQKI